MEVNVLMPANAAASVTDDGLGQVCFGSFGNLGKGRQTFIDYGPYVSLGFLGNCHRHPVLERFFVTR